MKKAIAASARRRVEILGLNACWMASFEVEYELRSVSDVQIASQVYAKPWPYGAIVATLAATPDLPADQLAKECVACVRAEITAGDRKTRSRRCCRVRRWTSSRLRLMPMRSGS